MKKIVASVGLVALASGINVVNGQESASTTPPYKPWNVSATLRGFYDDNINTVPTSSTNHQGSFGFQVSPAVNLNWSNDQTTLALGYIYTFRYYDKRPANNSVNYDQDQQFIASLNHSFSERYSVSVRDAFVLGQEPDMLRAANSINGGALSDFQRVSGNNIVNSGLVNFNAQLTPVFGLAAGFGNDYYNYADSGAQNVPGFGVGELVNGGTVFIPGASDSGLLDRSTSRLNLDGRWQVQPETIAVLGYMYEQVNYLSDEPVANQGGVPTGAPIPADQRNVRGSYFYVGADHNFRPDLSGTVRAGAHYNDYYNNDQTQWNPYFQANLQYNYTVESFAQVGFSYNNTATDQINAGPGVNNITLDANAFVFTASVKHRIIPNLFGSLVGQFQNSTFNGGTVDGDSQQYYLLGVNVQYQFNPYLSADVGYNYDQLHSADIPGQSFNRNRVYIGVTGSY